LIENALARSAGSSQSANSAFKAIFCMDTAASTQHSAAKISTNWVVTVTPTHANAIMTQAARSSLRLLIRSAR